MIIEITGLPGNGKTLYALSYVKQWAEKDSRPVFYAGITDLNLPWTEIKAEEWMNCPAGAIIVIDEAQKIFRPRMHGKEVPHHVAELETHRHKGFDIVLITQHPMLTDTAVRRLVGKHLHVVRKWGTESATIHEWPAIRENCDKPSGREDSIKHAWKYDKKAYGYYKSAELHTVKRSIPARVWMLMVIPFVLVFAAYTVYSITMGKAKPKEEKKDEPSMLQTIASPGALVAAPPGRTDKVFDPIADAKEFLDKNTPRVRGLIHTAPKYDELTKPTAVPVPAACLQKYDQCKCFSQQATPLDVPFNMCVEFAQNGFFQEFNPNGNREKAERRAAAMDAMDARQAPKDGKEKPKTGNLADGYGELGKEGEGVRQRSVDNVGRG